MNNKLSLAYLFLVIAPFFIGCRGSVKEENKNKASASAVSKGEVYRIDTTESVITWSGSMVMSPGKHTGYVHLSNGILILEKGQLVGATAEIDMHSMEYGDKEDKNTPIMHLKSPDYFDVEKFPTSTIVTTKVETVTDNTIKITGDLTIRDVTRPVTFTANLEVKDGIIKANGKLIIDRTEWGIRYRSGRFYDNLADQAVSDEVEFIIDIVAKSSTGSD